MAKTLTLPGNIASVDTRTAITAQGSVTAPSLVVPSGARMIKRILMAASAEGLANGSAVFFLRIGGNAVTRGEQVLMVSAAGTIAVQVGSDAAPQYCPAWTLEDANIEVTPSDTLSLSAEMAGSDLGTGRIVFTLVFE